MALSVCKIFLGCKILLVTCQVIYLRGYQTRPWHIKILMACLWTILSDESQTVGNSILRCSSPTLNPTYVPTYLPTYIPGSTLAKWWTCSRIKIARPIVSGSSIRVNPRSSEPFHLCRWNGSGQFKGCEKRFRKNTDKECITSKILKKHVRNNCGLL